MINPNTKNVIQRLVRERYTPISETTGDGASDWGGWQGGMPGSGSPLKGMRGGKNDTGRIQNQLQTVRRKKSAPGGTVGNLPKGNDGNIRLGPKTKVIVNPTIKQSENDIDLKNDLLTRPDNPASRGKAVRQVKESDLTENDILAGLVAKGVNHLLRKAFGGGKKPVRKTAAPKVAAAPKPPTAAQQKQANLDASQAHFNAWKRKKIAMDQTFKAAHAAGIGNDINPLRVRLDKRARAANPLKQPNGTPAAPASKPRIRVQAGSRIKESEVAPTNMSSGIAFFSPLLDNNKKASEET